MHQRETPLSDKPLPVHVREEKTGCSGSRRSTRGRSAPTRSTKRAKARPTSAARDVRAVRSHRASGGSVATKRQYAKWIETPGDHEERPGQSLATRNPEVIR